MQCKQISSGFKLCSLNSFTMKKIITSHRYLVNNYKSEPKIILRIIFKYEIYKNIVTILRKVSEFIIG